MIRHAADRLAAPSALVSLLLLGLCTWVSIVLFRQQEETAAVLNENVGSRQAAHELEDVLDRLAARQREGGPGVEDLQEQADSHLAKIQGFADKDEERRLAAQLAASFARYRELWQSGARDAALRVLEAQLLPYCRELRNYNAEQIDKSEAVHRHVLGQLAWQLAVVGVVGSLAGLLLGYGVARGLRRSIHQLRVRVRDAADKLGQDLPAVELTEGHADLHLLDEQVRDLVKQIEQVVAKLQQREREVLRAEQLAAVGQLAAGVAHELRNPLTSIKMLIQAGREDAGGGLADDDLRVIDHEIRRMERTLRTFLDFARTPKPQRRHTDLAGLVDHTLGLVRGRAGKQKVDLLFDRPASPVPAEVDGEQVQQVLVNLALNALDAMPRGGRLRVALSAGPGGGTEILVEDSGPGIAPELLPRLFEPFASGKETGLGLGLVVSRRIAEGHGGTLTGGNRPEGGARFVVRLPATTPS
jgi:signal transduction histidine kinase